MDSTPSEHAAGTAQDLPFRVGHGYDLHRLEPIVPGGQARPLRLGGVSIPHDTGPVGHSDADALLHAVTDAILGALGLPDIGQLFPDSDPEYYGGDSSVFVARAVAMVDQAGWRVANLDATVILERPKLAPVKGRIRENLSRLLGVSADRVNVKGKTHEGVDAVGQGRAVEVHAVVLLARRIG